MSLSSRTRRRESEGIRAFLQQRVSKGQTEQAGSGPDGPRALEHTDGSTGRAGGGGAGAQRLESAAEISAHQTVLTLVKI